MRTLSLRHYAGIVFLGALIVISSAWAFEVIGGYQPCALCLQQRIPYYVGVPLALIAVLLTFKPALQGLSRIALGLTALVFLISLFLAIRHAGVEWGWWLGASNCGATNLDDFGQSGSLLDELKDIKIVFCDEAAARFLGLSFAGWNAVASLILAGIALKGSLSRPVSL